MHRKVWNDLFFSIRLYCTCVYIDINPNICVRGFLLWVIGNGRVCRAKRAYY